MKLFLTILLSFSLSGCIHAQSGMSGNSGISGHSGQGSGGNRLVSVSIAPSSVSIPQNQTTTFVATGTFVDGSQLDVTLLATWTSSNPGIATISASSDPQPATCGVSANGFTVIQASYLSASGTASLTCLPIPLITTSSLANGTVSSAYSVTLGATGGTPPYTWSITSGSLPTGLSLNASTGVISGTPTVPGLYPFTVQVADTIPHTGSANLSINVVSSTFGQTELPRAFACELESYGDCSTGAQYSQSYANTINFTNTSGTLGTYPCATSHAPYAATVAGWNQALADLETCRTANAQSGRILVAPGTVLHATSTTGSACTSASTNCGLFVAQNAGDSSTPPVVIDSPTPAPTGSNAAGVARLGNYAISSSSGLARSSNVVTVTTAVAMAAVPNVGELARIAFNDDRSFGGEYTICGPPTTGCITPTSTQFTYQQTGPNATSQNGVVWSIEAQNTVSSAVSSGCATTNDACTITVNFAALPGCGSTDGICANTRIRWANATPSQFNGTWYVQSVSTNQITIFSYTEFIGNVSTSVGGQILGGQDPHVTNRILTDQVACCMYTIDTIGGAGGGDQAIIFGDQAHNFAMYDAEIEVDQTFEHETFQLVYLGSINQSAQTVGSPTSLQSSGCNGLPAQVNCDEPVHVGLDRDYIHGWSFPVVDNAAAWIRGAVKMECGWCYVTNSYLADINDSQSDSEGFGGKSGTGPFKVVNNYNEGSAEGSMTGSYQGCNIVNGNVTTSDWEIRRNYYTKNQFQCMNAAVKSLAGTGTKYFNYILKNDDEVKNSARELVDGNIFEESCGGAGQQNGALDANNSTDDNGNDTHYAQCNAQQGTYDITKTNNIYRHAGAWMYFPTRGGVTLPTARLNISNNLIYDLWNPTQYGRTGWQGTKWGGITFNFGLEIAARQQTFAACTGAVATVGGVPTATITCPVVTLTSGVTYPGLGIATGDFVNVFNCVDAHYDVLVPQEVQNTNPAGFNSYVITYTDAALASASGTTTGCSVSQAFGWPQYLTVTHNTLVADAGQTNAFYNNVAFNTNRLFVMPNTSNAAANTLSRNVTIQGNIFSTTGLTAPTKGSVGNNASLFFYAGLGTSNSQAECYFFDCNTLVLANNVFTNGVNSANYTEYNCPLGNCGVNNGASPPVTDFFVTDASIGFVGARATSNPPDFAPSPFDYHGFALSPASCYFAGHACDMPDGSSLGVDLTALDAAQVLKTYVCATTCGAGGGPYP